MADESHKYRRRSIRLRGYDYTTPGAYFVTICVHGRACIFGEVFGGEMRLNIKGRMIVAEWEALPRRFSTVALDAYVVMPNHIHGVLRFMPGSLPSVSLGDVVGAFKSLTTNAYVQGVHYGAWLPFERRLWQRNYYEQILRDDAALARVRKYIQLNPARWEQGTLPPTALS